MLLRPRPLPHCPRVPGPPEVLLLFCGFRNSVCVSVSVRAFRLRVYLIGNVHPTMATHTQNTSLDD